MTSVRTFSTQTILATIDEPNAPVLGNCLQAAVASYFSLPLESVPHFAQFKHKWRQAMALWLGGQGGDWRIDFDTIDKVPDDFCIVRGMSPRGIDHVCLAEKGEIIWDPHPSRSGLEDVYMAIRFIEMTPTKAVDLDSGSN